MSSATVFVGGYVPADMAAAVRDRARRAERSLSAELRLALRDRLAHSERDDVARADDAASEGRA